MPLEAINVGPKLSPEDEAVLALARGAADLPPANPENTRPDDVPAGELTLHTLPGKRVFPECVREGRVYVPAGYDGSVPTNLMVFQDGLAYLSDIFDVTATLDTLIAGGDIPPTIAVFVEPGDLIGHEGAQRANRSVEYDSLTTQYTDLLVSEVLTEVLKDLSVTADPARRAICGFSSGGIAAFTVAWNRPDLFGCVVSHCGSFTNLRGGGAYPSIVRTSEVRPVRVFLQSGANDMDRVAGSWAVANFDMAAALRLKGYDYRFEFGNGGHTLHHGASIFPQTLRWLWG